MNVLINKIGFLSISLTLLASSLTHAFVAENLVALKKANITCTVDSAFQMDNGVITKRLAPGHALLTTMVQDGGKEFLDAKCFKIPVVNLEGQKTTISFGCLPLDDKHVREFSAERLEIRRRESGEKLEMNFKTGLGHFEFTHSGSDWGRERYSGSADVVLSDCKIN